MSDQGNLQTEIATTGRSPGNPEPLLSGSDVGLGAAYREALPSAPTPAPELAKGTRLGERYEIIGTLGRGGMGVVYEACNTNVEHIRYAIKTLIPGRPQADAEHFIEEARRASKVRSPHIVKIFDFSTDTATGLTYMVMDYIGEDLDKYIRRHGNTLPAAKAVDFCIQVCDALAAAHAEKVVHRDIKPLNCLLRVDSGHETIVVTDFGIARDILGAAASAEGGTGQDSAWTTVGTPGYIAPEVWLREGRADHRVDIYSVGAMLFRILTGKVPPLAPRAEELQTSEIPAALQGVLRTALARAPRDRYSSARAMQSALREALPALQERALSSPRRLSRPVLSSMLLVMLVILIIAFAAVLKSLLRGDDPAPIAIVTSDGVTVPAVVDVPPGGSALTMVPAPGAMAPGSNDAVTDTTGVASPTGEVADQPIVAKDAPKKDASKRDTKAVPKKDTKPPVLLPLPLFAATRADLAKSLAEFCRSPDGVQACVSKLELKKSDKYKADKLVTKLYFDFAPGAQLPSLRSKEPRLDLKTEAEFAACVESKLWTWGQSRLVATVDGGQVSCPVVL